MAQIGPPSFLSTNTCSRPVRTLEGENGQELCPNRAKSRGRKSPVTVPMRCRRVGGSWLGHGAWAWGWWTRKFCLSKSEVKSEGEVGISWGLVRGRWQCWPREIQAKGKQVQRPAGECEPGTFANWKFSFDGGRSGRLTQY